MFINYLEIETSNPFEGVTSTKYVLGTYEDEEEAYEEKSKFFDKHEDLLKDKKGEMGYIKTSLYTEEVFNIKPLSDDRMEEILKLANRV